MNQTSGFSLFNLGNNLTQRWRMKIFAITWLAYASFYFTRKAFSVAKLGIAEDPNFALEKATLANLDALYLGAYAVGQFTWGILADRFGPRVVVLSGLLISALAAMVMGTFATLPIFASCMLIQGLAQSTGWSGLCKNIGSFFATSARGRIMGLWSSCYAFGGLVASPFAGWWAYQIYGDWRAAFLSSATVVVIVAILFFIFQRNSPEDVGLPPVEDVETSPHGRHSCTTNFTSYLKAIVQNRTVLVLGLAYFLLKPARYAILFWGPVMVYERMPEIGKVASSIVPTSFEVAGLIGPVILGLISDRLFSARRFPACVISLVALAGCLALVVPVMQSGSVLLLVSLLFMVGLTLYGPDSMISSTAAIDFGRGTAGTAAGFVNGCGSIGAVLGGLLPGNLDTESVFLVFTATALLATAMMIPYWNSRPNTATVATTSATA